MRTKTTTLACGVVLGVMALTLGFFLFGGKPKTSPCDPLKDHTTRPWPRARQFLPFCNLPDPEGGRKKDYWEHFMSTMPDCMPFKQLDAPCKADVECSLGLRCIKMRCDNPPKPKHRPKGKQLK